jgi:hypothetical protein
MIGHFELLIRAMCVIRRRRCYDTVQQAFCVLKSINAAHGSVNVQFDGKDDEQEISPDFLVATSEEPHINAVSEEEDETSDSSIGALGTLRFRASRCLQGIKLERTYRAQEPGLEVRSQPRLAIGVWYEPERSGGRPTKRKRSAVAANNTENDNSDASDDDRKRYVRGTFRHARMTTQSLCRIR